MQGIDYPAALMGPRHLGTQPVCVQYMVSSRCLGLFDFTATATGPTEVV